MKDRFYVSLSAPGRLGGASDSRWKRPDDEGFADWVEVDDGPFSSLAINRTEGLLYHNSLKEELYTAEYRGFLVDVPAKYFGGDTKGWAVAARQARLIRQVESWSPISAAVFACDCAEKALDAIKAKDAERGSTYQRDQVEERETLAYIRQMAEIARANEPRVREGPMAEYGLHTLPWFLEDQMKEASDRFQELGATLDTLLETHKRVGASMYAARAVRAICYLSIGIVTNEAPKAARDTMSALHFFMDRRDWSIKDLNEDPQLRARVDAEGKQVWEEELQWQARRFEEVIDEDEWWPDDD